jgi:hypothetical protein
MVKQVSRSSGISSGFRVFFIFSAILAHTSSAWAGSGQLTSKPSDVNFGSVQVGSSQTQAATLTNVGSSSLIITQATASSAAFTLTGLSYPVILSAGKTVTCNVTFNPQSAGTSSGSIAIKFHNRHNTSATYTLTVPVSGTGVTPGQVTSTPTSLTFGSVTVGSKQSLSETVTNTVGSSVTISQVGISGTSFSLSGIAPPVTLTAGQSTTFTVTFAPAAVGTFPGTVTVTSNASNPSMSIPLSGTAVASAAGTLTAVPTTVAVPGSIVVGASGTATGRLSATTASVTVSGVSVVGSEFVISGLAFPVTIPAGSSATYNITFSPTSSGSASTTASFASNASNAPTGVSLTGTAVAAPVYAVGLTWTASGSTGVMGYYVYRALYNTSTSTCGSYTKLNPASPNTTTTYTDSGITDGDTYCYQVTAVNSSGEQSTDSNMATAIIPAP